MPMNLKNHIRQIPDFPQKGILFYDISTLLANAAAWQETINRMAEIVAPWKPDLLVGIESRGFLVGAPLALKLKTGFVMARKPGKLPGSTIRHDYQLEYGADSLEIQKDAIRPGQRIVVVDDLLATGGTMAATIELLRKAGAEVAGAAFVVELTFLEGRKKLDVPASALVSYDQ